MRPEIFYWVLNMSMTASLTGAFVMLIRSIKKMPRRFAMLLWLIPYLRMTVPFGLSSRYSLMSLLSPFAIRTVIIYRIIHGVSGSMMNCVNAASSYFPVVFKTDLLEDVFDVASAVWIIVSTAIIFMLAAVYFTTLGEMRDAVRLRGRIYLSDKITSPAVYGIIRPKIILPMSYKDKDIELIILHEKMHIRRADNLWRMLAFFITAVHWFNPLCWIFLKLFLEDLELACDERVLARLGEDRAKEYALSLIESGQSATVFTSAFGGAKIRTRIENILSFKKITLFSLIALTAFIGAIFYVLLTNA